MLRTEKSNILNRLTIVLMLALLTAVTFEPACKSGDDKNGTTGPPDDTTDTTESPFASMAASGPTLASTFGISSHLSKSADYSRTREFELEKLAEAGIHTVRTDFNWDRIEAVEGEYTPEGYDEMVNLTIAAGLDLCAIVDFGVDWAMPDGSHDEIDPDVFGGYASYLATRYGDRIDYYEIWNEQNTSRFWKPEPNPEAYGNLLKASADAIRAADPESVIVFGGLSSYDEYLSGPDGFWAFIVQTWEYHNDLCDYIDGFAIHPYTFLQAERPEVSFEFEGWDWLSYTEMIYHARDLLEKIGCRDKEIWLTETGWPSINITEANQAAYLARSLLLALSAGATKYMWYTFWDGSGNAVPVTEDYFGLFSYPREDEVAKPSYDAFAAAYNIAGNFKYAGNLGEALGWSEEDNIALVLTDEASQMLITVWKNTDSATETGEATVPLPDGAGAWTIYDQFGTVIEEGTGGEELQITTSLNVTYIVVNIASE